jgi:lambda family phage tail tape measure protein
VNAAKLQGLTLDEYKRIQDGKKAIGTPGTELVNASAALSVAQANLAVEKALPRPRKLVLNSLEAEVSSTFSTYKSAYLRSEKATGEVMDLSEKIKADAEARAKDAKSRIAANRIGVSGVEGLGATGKPDKTLVAQENAYQKLVDAITDKVALAEREIEVGGKLTEAMRFELDMRDKINDAAEKYKKDNKTGLSPDKEGEARAFLYKATAALKLVEVQHEENKARDEAGKVAAKSVLDESEAFKKATLSVKVYNEQLEIKAQASRETTYLPPSQRASVDAEADYKAKFADEIAAQKKAQEAIQAAADSAWLSVREGKVEDVKSYAELAASADKAALRVEALREQVLAGAKDAGREASELVKLQRSGTRGMQLALSSYLDSIGNTAEHVSSTVSNAFKGMETALVEFVKTGKLDFGSLADSIISDLIRIQIQQNIMKPLAQASQGGGGLLDGLFNLFGSGAGGNSGGGSGVELADDFFKLFLAKGGAFDSGGGVRPFAKGGAFANSLLTSPTMFKFASGGGFNLGVAGEAGPEAVMPLRRTASGDLGVIGQSNSGGGNTVIVNVVESPGNGGQQSRRSEGGQDIITVFVEKVKSSIASDIGRGQGAVPAAMAQTYGLNRVVGAY